MQNRSVMHIIVTHSRFVCTLSNATIVITVYHIKAKFSTISKLLLLNNFITTRTPYPYTGGAMKVLSVCGDCRHISVIGGHRPSLSSYLSTCASRRHSMDGLPGKTDALFFHFTIMGCQILQSDCVTNKFGTEQIICADAHGSM